MTLKNAVATEYAKTCLFLFLLEVKKCDNCGDCADVCPMEVLILEDEKLTINEPDECSYCESCADICPNECITIE